MIDKLLFFMFKNTCDIVKGLMELNPEDLRFTLMALSVKQDD